MGTLIGGFALALSNLIDINVSVPWPTGGITERLWQSLNELAPRRGVARELQVTEMLVNGHWPEADPNWRDEELEGRFAFMQELVTNLRETRARYGVTPRQTVPLRIKAAGAAAATLSATRRLIGQMAMAEPVEIDAAAARTTDAATVVVRDVEAYVLGVVDPEAERKKLEKQRDKLQGRIGGTEKKLGNAGFLEKAPPEVVEREKQNLEGLRAQLASLEQNLRALGG